MLPNSNNLMREYFMLRQQNMTNNDRHTTSLFVPNSKNPDPEFMRRMNMAKIEQMNKARSIRDLNMSEQELIKYIINPIQIEKVSNDEKNKMMSDFGTQNNTYMSLQKYNMDSGNKLVPKAILDLWQKRTNNPYKQVLHKLSIDDYTKKKYEKLDDLIVYKTTQLDKVADVRILKSELDKLTNLIIDQNNELKIIYCTDKKHEFLEQFEYANKYNNRIRYDPTNYAELKELYKREQTKLEKENNRINELLEMMFVVDDISKEDLEEIKKIQKEEAKIISNSHKTSSLLKHQTDKHSDPEEIVDKPPVFLVTPQKMIDKYKKK